MSIVSFWCDENVLIVVMVCVYNKNHLSLQFKLMNYMCDYISIRQCICIYIIYIIYSISDGDKYYGEI